VELSFCNLVVFDELLRSPSHNTRWLLLCHKK